MKSLCAVLITGALTLWLASCSASETPQTTGEAEFAYYDVRSDTLAALRQDMFRVSPVRQDGESFAAFTDSNWNWWINWQPEEAACHVTDVTIDVRTVITFPRWTRESAASEQDRAEWKRYAEALLRHERQHEAISMETVSQIREGLESLPPAADCDTLYANAKRLASRLEQEGQARHAAFDKRTDHGARDGAAFK